MKLTITDAELGSLVVQLRTWQPPPEIRFRGLVLFASGAFGDTFLSNEGGTQTTDHCNARMMEELAEIGFFVIDAKWEGDNIGWKNTSYGLRREAARFATLVKYLHKRYFDCDEVGLNFLWKGPFIVVGQSSGAAEVAYGLTTYNLEPYVDLALLTSGPAEARIDQICSDNTQTGSCDPGQVNVTWCDDLFCSSSYKTSLWSGSGMCNDNADEPEADICGDDGGSSWRSPRKPVHFQLCRA